MSVKEFLNTTQARLVILIIILQVAVLIATEHKKTWFYAAGITVILMQIISLILFYRSMEKNQ